MLFSVYRAKLLPHACGLAERGKRHAVEGRAQCVLPSGKAQPASNPREIYEILGRDVALSCYVLVFLT